MHFLHHSVPLIANKFGGLFIHDFGHDLQCKATHMRERCAGRTHESESSANHPREEVLPSSGAPSGEEVCLITQVD